MKCYCSLNHFGVIPLQGHLSSANDALMELDGMEQKKDANKNLPGYVKEPGTHRESDEEASIDGSYYTEMIQAAVALHFSAQVPLFVPAAR